MDTATREFAVAALGLALGLALGAVAAVVLLARRLRGWEDRLARTRSVADRALARTLWSPEPAVLVPHRHVVDEIVRLDEYISRIADDMIDLYDDAQADALAGTAGIPHGECQCDQTITGSTGVYVWTASDPVKASIVSDGGAP